jgi:MHS family proline/betaine transporter-like MFS transporter
MELEFVQSNIVIAIALVLGTPFFIYFGKLSDKVGRKKIMMSGLLLAALAYYPIYQAMDNTVKLEHKQELPGQYRIESKLTPNKDGSSTERLSRIRVYDDGTQVKETTSTTGAKTEVKREVTVSTATMGWLVLLVFIQVLFVTMVYAPIAAFLVELFPTRIRYTSMSLPYHLGNGVFGGLLPTISTLLVTQTHHHLAGLIYPIGIAVVCFFIGVFFIKDPQAEGELVINN